jgi:ribonucleoside-triphosphate reductase
MSPIQVKRQECIVYSRVVGYLSPIQGWNKAKREEFKDRKTFNLDK